MDKIYFPLFMWGIFFYIAHYNIGSTVLFFSSQMYFDSDVLYMYLL